MVGTAVACADTAVGWRSRDVRPGQAGESQWGIRSGMMRRMTTQISVRLPDEMVSFLDRCVSEGRVASRAEIIAGAVEREMRREAAMRDTAILAEVGSADDLDDLVAWSVEHPEMGS